MLILKTFNIYKRKINFIITLLFCHLSLLAQDLPDYTLPSPQSYQMTKYGDVTVNETSGKISPSIPLYNHKCGNIKLPIALNYNGNGVKVTDLPTWTGNNWTLQAGGLITRVVKDLPDETSMPRKFYNKSELDSFLIDESNIASNIKSIIINKDNYDNEVDIFNYSFAGYSGSFFLEIISELVNGQLVKSIKPHIINKQHDLKIELLQQGNFNESSLFEFVITTPEGVKYTFGGYATEETEFVDRGSNPPIFGDKHKTAFYLTKIQNHIGDIINFEYHSKDEYEVLSYTNQTLIKDITLPITNEPCLPEFPNISNQISDLRKVKTITNNGLFLKRIWDSSGLQVLFNSFEVTTPNQYYRVLSDIQFIDKSIVFEYWRTKDVLQTNQSYDKFFLKDVMIKNFDGSSLLKEYKFEYFDLINVPSLDSFAQDYLGYFNGITTNTNLLPKNHNEFLDIHIPNISPILKEKLQFNSFQSILADREPNFEYAIKGMLKKIHYPTGGFTEFEYEPVKKKYIKKNLFLDIYSNMGNASPSWTPNTVFSDINSISNTIMPDNSTAVSAVPVDQLVTFNLEINTLDTNLLDYHDYIYLTISDLTENAVITEKFNFPTSVVPSESNNQTKFVYSYDYNLKKDHSYSIKIGFGDNYAGEINSDNTSHFSSTSMYVNVNVSYISGIDENNGLGIRIKRVKDYKEDNKLANYKRYYYKKAIDLDKDLFESNVDVYAPFFLSSMSLQSICDPPSFTEAHVKNRYYAILNSNAKALNLPFSDAMSYYEDITISYGGDNFENGGVEKTFHVIPNKLPDVYADMLMFHSLDYNFHRAVKKVTNSNRSNLGLFNGTLIKSSTLLKKEDDQSQGILNSLFKQSEISYKYDFFENFKSNNITGEEIMGSLYILYPDTNMVNIYIGLYSTFSLTPQLKSVENKIFNNPIPLSRYLPPVLEQGYAFQDDDNDGVFNIDDPDFITPEIFNSWSDEERINYIELESNKVVVKEINEFSPLITTQPISNTLFTSNSKAIKTYYHYPFIEHINELSDLSDLDISSYQFLFDQNRVNTPIQTKTVLIEESGLEKSLSLLRNTYKDYGQNNNQLILPEFIKKTKGNNVFNLEDKIEFVNYDNYGNPQEIKKADGTSVLYFWSTRRNPIFKIVGLTYNQFLASTNSSGINISENMTSLEVESLYNLFPNANIYRYKYKGLTDLITSMTDARGQTVYYEYDEFNRLKHVKDEDGNILSENQYNYANQN